MFEIQHQRSTSKRHWSALILLVLGTVILLVCAWPASAAIELLYFNVATSRSAVLLEWSTAKEYNLLGFQVMCKQASESDASYHPIGTRSATGSTTSGGNYEFLVTSGLTEGVPYCFRLREITSNGEPGEIFDRCGFGLNMTPTPTLLPEFVAATSTAVAAAAALSQTLIVTDSNGITSTVDPLLLTATPTIDPLILALTPSPIPQQPGSPLLPTDTPTLDPVLLAQMATATAAALATAQQAQFDANATAAVANATAAAVAATSQAATATALVTTATITASPTITSSLTPTAVVNVAGVVDPNAPVPVAAGAETPMPDAAAAAAVPQDPNLAAAVLPPPVDNTSYVVVTAVPTLAPIALAPTLTPLPTGIPTQVALIGNMFAATTQNMMVLLLLVVFSGATGIGVLGLLSGVLYVRMRSGRRRRYDY